MNILRKLAVVVIALGSVSVAHAAVLDFEHLDTASYGGVHVDFVEEDGFLIYPVLGSLSVFEDGWQSNRGASNGTNTMGTYGFQTTLAFGLRSIDGSAFSLNSIDLTGLVQNSDPNWIYNTDSVRFVAEFTDGSSITDDFVLDSVNDGIGGLDDFETYNFSSYWTSLTSVLFYAINNNGAYTSYLNFDNIVVNESVSGPEPVTIDIKPGGDPNCFNINGHGVIPVAVLGSDSLDVIDVDISTLSFGGLALRMRGNKGAICGYEDSNDDGMQDLVCQFEDDPSAWSVGSDSATLSGELLDGSPFEGSDSICVVP